MTIDYMRLDKVVSVLGRLPDRYTANNENPEMWNGEYVFLSFIELEKLTACGLL